MQGVNPHPDCGQKSHGHPDQSTTWTGHWYATAMFWGPQVACSSANRPYYRCRCGWLRSDLTGPVPAASRRGARRTWDPSRGPQGGTAADARPPPRQDREPQRCPAALSTAST